MHVYLMHVCLCMYVVFCVYICMSTRLHTCLPAGGVWWRADRNTMLHVAAFNGREVQAFSIRGSCEAEVHRCVNM